MRETSIAQMFSGTLPQLIAVITGTMSAVSDGMQYAWSAPFIPILERENSPVKITEADVSWLESSYMIGGVAGLPITIYFVDAIGRKKTIIASACCSLVAWCLIGFANHVAYIYAARFLAGLAADVTFVSAPMYIAEIADQRIRGFLASLIYLMMLLGVVIIYSVAPYVPYYVTPIIGGIILIFQLSTFTFQPESPYYLLNKRKTGKAKKALTRLRTGTIGDIEKELQEITTAVERQKTERGRPQDLILVNSNRKALIIMTVLNAAQHFSSISVILMNLHSILEAAGSIYIDSNIAAIIFACFMLSAASVASFVIDKYGRRILLILSSTFTGLSLLTLAIYFTLKANNVDVSTVSWIPIASVMIYAIAFKFGLGMIPIVLTAELFPTKLKAMGMTISDLMYVVFSLISIQLYTNLSSMYGIHVPFFIFAGSTIGTALFAFFYIPETKGKTLEEIQFILKGKSYSSPTDKSIDSENKDSNDENNLTINGIKLSDGGSKQTNEETTHM